MKWHNPGLGEVHNEYHSQMIYCEDADGIVDDGLAKEVCDLLNSKVKPVQQAEPALDAETAIKNCLEAGETIRVLKRVVNLLLESRRNLGPEDHELRDRIDQLFRPDAAIAAQSAQGKEGHR